MPQKRIFPLALLGACTLATLAASYRPPPECHLQVIPDYELAISYKAVLQLSPHCSPAAVLRVRKSSTLNTRRGGAPWQPIAPKLGAWEVGRGVPLGKRVPDLALWTMTYPRPWRWEWFDTSRQVWAAAEVLHAGP